MFVHRSLLLACLALSACVTTRPRTEALVDIQADEFVSDELASIELLVEGGPPGGAIDTTFSDTRRAPFVFPMRVTILPMNDDATRVFSVRVIGRTATNEIIGRQRIRGRFSENMTTRVDVVLEDCCASVAHTCSDDQTCTECACRAVGVVTPSDAGTGDATVPDGGIAELDASEDREAGPSPGSDAGRTTCPPASCMALPCETAVLDCSGATPRCIRERRPAGTLCRRSAGPCDVPEFCDGEAPRCPDDMRQPTTHTCRTEGVTPECSRDGFCDGVSVTCADVLPDGSSCGPCQQCSGGVCDTVVCAQPGFVCCASSNACQPSGAVCAN